MNTFEKAGMPVTLSNEVKKYCAKKTYYSEEQFINDAQRYIQAIKERRMLCVIRSVSSSGMSRVIKFSSCEMPVKTELSSHGANYRQYSHLFLALGYKEVKNTDTFRINGCGMDMIFHTNYSIIHDLHRMGFIDKKECDSLAQNTPVVI